MIDLFAFLTTVYQFAGSGSKFICQIRSQINYPDPNFSFNNTFFCKKVRTFVVEFLLKSTLFATF